MAEIGEIKHSLQKHSLHWLSSLRPRSSRHHKLILLTLYSWFQEELAFMFEMLGLFEDSLVQYDELDALFTQFVLNHAAGGKHRF